MMGFTINVSKLCPEKNDLRRIKHPRHQNEHGSDHIPPTQEKIMLQVILNDQLAYE